MKGGKKKSMNDPESKVQSHQFLSKAEKATVVGHPDVPVI